MCVGVVWKGRAQLLTGGRTGPPYIQVIISSASDIPTKGIHASGPHPTPLAHSLLGQKRQKVPMILGAMCSRQPPR